MASQGARHLSGWASSVRDSAPVVILDPIDVRGLSALEPDTRDTSRPHDVIVSAEALGVLKDAHPDLVQSAERLRVIDASDTGEVREAVDAPFASPLPRGGRAAKRALDILVAVATALVLAPVLVIACVAVKATSPGPVLFRQVRTGQDGRRFEMLKLRTMAVNNDDSEHRRYVAEVIAGTAAQHDGTFKLTGDPRVTAVGRVLRRFSIDEVPQLLNVLRGDMSVIGPRPPLPHEVDLYDARAWLRLRVRPGLTGLWQVSGRCELTFEQMIDLDIRYWRDWTLLRDLSILAKTPAVVLGGKGAA
jgi:lipopolysaccharide/colanic/teichoic acid biosynthesis glycosyltransferase